LHWASDALLAFVDHFTEWLTDLPLLVVITARPDFWNANLGDARLPECAHNQSVPLTDAEIEELLAG